MPAAHHLEIALQSTRDRSSFLKNLLIDALGWPIPDHVDNPEDIAYSWSAADLRAEGLDKKLVAGQVWQLQPLQANQPWGIFLLEFTNPDAFTSGRGLTGPLRKVLRGLVPSRRQHSNLATWKREHLLFICTHGYQHFRFAYFKAPPDNARAAPLAAFGWGPDMPARTACEFNLPALAWPDADTNDADWVRDWAAAFDVEKVTKKFYEEYAAIFAAVEKAIAAENGVEDEGDLRMFTQTLVNRLMFLRFLERKGWLKFQGREDYLRALHDGGPFGKKSFYRGRLLPLFFEGLAIEQHGPSEAFGEVPFLNGGLFEPTDLDKSIKEVPYAALGALIGQNGLFYRFNFTVQESTPLDIEVAVDPEMLGKVFEELVTGRHESGSYYTPRPIVSFMCREAIKGFLANKTKASPEALTALVDQATVAGLTEAHGRQILDALDALKAVDPACGSGAYLLGLLHELVAIYRLLMSEKLVKDRRSLYDLKLRIISHNLYGVDIDPFATNIAMLRLWLSLEVEADTPLPLPNLDFKIETGDSLVGPDPEAPPSDLTGIRIRVIADTLLGLKDNYLTAHGKQRETYRQAIAQFEKEIEDLQGSEHGQGIVDWWVQFAEVFARDRGFDIVLANPPYVRQELIKALKPTLKNVYQNLYSGTADLYVFFYLRGLQLLAPGGMLVFISSNKWFRAGYGEKLRAHIAKTTTVQTILDFHDLPVFDAIAYPMIFIAKKLPPTEEHTAILAEPPNLEAPYPDVKEVVAKYGHEMPKTALGKDGTWHLAASIVSDKLSKMRQSGDVLANVVSQRIYRGVMTGLNEAFIIDRETRESLIGGDSACEHVIRPIAAGKDVAKWHIRDSKRWLLFIPWDFDLKKYPSIKRHLSKFREQLENRPDVREGRHAWWALSRYGAEHVDDWNHANIAYQEIATYQGFSLGKPGQFYNNKAFFVVSDDRYLLGVLNSKSCWWFLGEVTAKLVGGAYALQRPYMEQIPIPDASAADRSAIAALAQKCLDAQGVGCESWEKEIDERVAALYGLDASDLGDKASRPAPASKREPMTP